MNVGVGDRFIRCAIGIVLFLTGLYYFTGLWKWIVTIIGLLIMLTAGIGYSLIYKLIGKSTVKEKI